ncbi:MAG: hypothetical protein KJS95_11920 [Gammaproteobacteria bacterium]|nr:hypothetical protein [Gammaproteobacteria bacterium]
MRAVAATLVMMLLVVAGGPVRGQTNSPVQISVPSTLLVEPASETGLGISVGPPDNLPRNAFMRLRGLPSQVTLSEGYLISAGSWAIPLFSLSRLKLIVPAGSSGRSEISVALVSIEGDIISEVRSVLVIGPAAAIPKAEPARPAAGAAPTVITLTPPAPPPTPVPAGKPAPKAEETAAAKPIGEVARQKLSGEELARAERSIAQGAKSMEQGNIAVARQFFLRAAEMGSAQAAMRLAESYDPDTLQRLQVRGLVGDVEEARKWYARARELGETVAAEAALSRLAKR